MREFLRAKIHRARVTAAHLEYEGSFGIDANYLKEVGILPYESIEIYNVTNGARVRTYAIELPAGSRRFESNGAAAHLIRPNDIVIIACYTLLKDEEVAAYSGPTIMLLGDQNQKKDDRKIGYGEKYNDLNL